MKKEIIKRFLCQSHLINLIRTFNHTPRVLFYHGVDHVPDDSIPTLHIEPEMFEKQMSYISDYNEVISMDEYYVRFSQKAFTGKEVVITLDDGYRNNLTVAAPILQSFHFPFTVFISTKHITDGTHFPTWIVRAIILNGEQGQLRIDCLGIHTAIVNQQKRMEIFKTVNFHLKNSDLDRVNLICEQLIGNISPAGYRRLLNLHCADAPMNWEEVDLLKSTYNCTIGSHCQDHFICNSSQKEEEVKRQITESRKIIREKLCIPCDYLAYPNGDTSPVAIQKVQEAGYKMAFTISNRRRGFANPFTQPRCPARFELNDFMIKLAFRPRY